MVCRCCCHFWFYRNGYLHCLSFIAQQQKHLHIFALANFMTLDKRNCIIWIGCCTLALVSLGRFFFLSISSIFLFYFPFFWFNLVWFSILLLVFTIISTDLFAINSKRIFPWLFCLWSSVVYIRIPSYCITLFCK